MTDILHLTAAHERPVRALWLLLILAPLLGLVALGGKALLPRPGSEGFTIDVPPSPPPTVEPLELKAVAPEAAQAINAAIPFIDEKIPPAKPFNLTGSANDTARATDCLASALFYEAGAELIEGQKAVAQVILNRVRHPAYPATVCGVVYQGVTRRTGCQFSFSCDGSMARRPSDALWQRLRGIAMSMLHGEVYAPVGLATHYHTDWVVPYWSAKLDKVRSEQSHLFFRWNGWWGTPTAFRQRYAGGEPLVTRMAGLSTAHASALAGEVALDAGGVMPEMVAAGAIITPARLDPVFASPAGNFLIFATDRHAEPAGLAAAASSACGPNTYCKVMVWADRAAAPTTLPISDAQRDSVAFSYLRDPKSGTDKALWNCNVFRRVDPAQCMRATVPMDEGVKPAKGVIPVVKGGVPVAKPPVEDRETLIPIDPDVVREADPSDRLKPGTDSFGGRRRPGGG
jgi:spore germination cell wall hydrolase CwlJ-like protein